MKIYVRRRHIKAGHRNSSHNCPIALAISEMVDDDPIVQPWYVQIGAMTHDLPEAAHRFIGKFDAGKPVKPFAFTIK